MKKRFTRLLFLALLLCNVHAFAQWQIEINGVSPSTTKLCVGQGFYIRAYNGATNETGACTFLVDQENVIGQTGASEGGYYLVVDPADMQANNQGGVHIIALFAGSPVCSLAVTVYPTGTTANSITGVSPATNVGTYNFAAGILTGPPTYTISGPYAGYYTATTSGTTCTVTPNMGAPLFDYVDVNASWIPTGSSCGSTAYGSFTGRINITPIIAATNNLNVLCSGGSNTLSVTNAPDISGYPSTPSPTTLPHYVYQWYNSSGAISGATNSTYTATTVGSYHATITQYNYYGTSWSTTAEGTATSNTITLGTPGTGTLNSSFTINGLAPAATQATATNYFYCDAVTFANTSTVGSGGVINTYDINISNSSGASVYFQSGNGLPPSSLDLSGIFQGLGVSGAYEIYLTVTNGCSISSTYSGYIYISGPPTSTSLTTTVHTASTANTYPSTSYQDAWTPLHVGVSQTVFNLGGSFVSSATSCTYKALIYNTPSKYDIHGNPISPVPINFNTAIPLWSGNTITTGCSSTFSTGITITSIGTTNFWSLLPNGSEYYVAFELTNDCGSAYIGEYVQTDNTYLRMDNEGVNNVTSSGNAITFYPVPFTDNVNVNINAAADANANLVIYTVDGRTISTVLQNETVAHGQTVKTINTANWAAGIYFYKLMLGDKVYSGKITK